jgi:hypothetical protein
MRVKVPLQGKNTDSHWSRASLVVGKIPTLARKERSVRVRHPLPLEKLSRLHGTPAIPLIRRTTKFRPINAFVRGEKDLVASGFELHHEIVVRHLNESTTESLLGPDRSITPMSVSLIGKAAVTEIKRRFCAAEIHGMFLHSEFPVATSKVGYHPLVCSIWASSSAATARPFIAPVRSSLTSSNTLGSL